MLEDQSCHEMYLFAAILKKNGAPDDACCRSCSSFFDLSVQVVTSQLQRFNGRLNFRTHRRLHDHESHNYCLLS